jgi:drug/metabolite transporter (DMT)-like permease
MSIRAVDYGYLAATIALSAYGQLILKWRLAAYGQLPETFWEKARFLTLLVLDPAIFSGFVAAFLAALTWMAALTRFELGYAYALMSLTFVVVLLLSALLLHEPLSTAKIAGVLLIIAGTVVASNG